MGQEHTPTAVALQAERIKRIALRVVRLEQLKILVPLVPDDLAAREAAHGDDHLGGGAGAERLVERAVSSGAQSTAGRSGAGRPKRAAAGERGAHRRRQARRRRCCDDGEGPWERSEAGDGKVLLSLYFGLSSFCIRRRAEQKES